MSKDVTQVQVSSPLTGEQPDQPTYETQMFWNIRGKFANAAVFVYIFSATSPIVVGIIGCFTTRNPYFLTLLPVSAPLLLPLIHLLIPLSERPMNERRYLLQMRKLEIKEQVARYKAEAEQYKAEIERYRREDRRRGEKHIS